MDVASASERVYKLELGLLLVGCCMETFQGRISLFRFCILILLFELFFNQIEVLTMILWDNITIHLFFIQLHRINCRIDQ